MEAGSTNLAAPRRGRPRKEDGPPPTLEEVVAAFVKMAKEQKDVDIGMRDLARALGVSPKLLYRYVASKDELMQLAAAHILRDWTPPATDLPWQERLQALMRGSRSLIRQYPTLAEPFVLRNFEVQDSPEVARLVAPMRACLEEGGLTLQEANQVFYMYQALLLGELSISSALRKGVLTGDRLPDQAKLDDSFETGLRYLISGLNARRHPDGPS